MKRTIKSLLLGISAIAFASCLNEIPDYESNASRSINSDLTVYDSVTIENVSVNLPSDYIRGFDASAVDYYEQNKKINNASVWYDTDRTQKDFFEILKEHGVNTVRLRIWNDPSQEIAVDGSHDDCPPDGDNTLARTLKMAGRVKAAGLKLMIDFHYSDYWTDPGKQVVPVAWQNANPSSADDVAKLLYSYTKSVLSSLKAIGASPDYVQVGNEINGGMLLHKKVTYNSSSQKWTGNTEFSYSGTPNGNLAKYFAAGTKAVRDVCGTSTKVIAHLSISPSTNHTTILGTTLKNLSYNETSVDYDMIGLSYYPFEEEHGTISDMKTLVSSWISTYGKDVFIAEVAAPWNATDDEWLKNQYTNLKDSNYTDLDMGSNSDQYIGSIANQARIIRHVIEESADAGAVGVCYWGGETMGSNNWKYSMFEYTGLALPSLAVFGVQGGNTLGVGNTSTNVSGAVTKTATVANAVEFSMTGTKNSSYTTDTALASSYFSSYTNSTVSKIVASVSFASDLTWGSSIKIVIGSDWIDTGTWDNSVITFTITDSSQISTILTDGIKLGSDYNGKGYVTVTITYTE